MEENTFWPIAYNSVLHQLISIIKLYREILIDRKNYLSKIQEHPVITSDYARNLPTTIHYAVASLGAWLGGAANIQFFLHYACNPQILKSEKNIEYAKSIGYSEQECHDMDESGIISVPFRLWFPLMEAQNCKEIFGTLPIDEFNIVNPPNEKEESLKIDNNLKGLIVDKYYRSPFFAKNLNKNYGLYGSNNILRDHYKEFYKEVLYTDLFRCKHYCYPIINVSSIEEIQKLIEDLINKGSIHIVASLYTSEEDYTNALFGKKI